MVQFSLSKAAASAAPAVAVDKRITHPVPLLPGQGGGEEQKTLKRTRRCNWALPQQERPAGSVLLPRRCTLEESEEGRVFWV